MSFQGDVAGIGLGELLQGLARGGKDGVLTLYGDGKLAAAIGLQGSQVFLLEGPEEDPDEWRLRCDRAWFLQPDPDLDLDRREAIARAARREVLFQMLEAPNLHFRFEPGQLPKPKGKVQRGSGFALEADEYGSDSPWGPGVGVEFLLLEYARIADESSSSVRPGELDVPVALVQGGESVEEQLLFEQIDARSTCLEIADRMGWPASQVRGLISDLVEREQVRLATSSEQLALAHVELESERFDRAARHLTSWLEMAPPGPPMHGEAELIFECWQSGLLRRTLPDLGDRQARALVRKLDTIDPDLDHQLDRWRELCEDSDPPPITRLHYHALRARLPDDQRQGADSELLRIARHFLAHGETNRAQAVLRLVSELAPSSLGTRIELGSRLLEADLIDLGADWMIEAAQELVVASDFERAIAVLHSLLQSAPNHRVANGMLLETRERLRRKNRRRWHTIGAASLVLLVSCAGIVKFQMARDREAKLVEITDLLDSPDTAIELLDRYFPEDDSQRVSALRIALHKRKQAEQEAAAEAWLSRFEGIEISIRGGELDEAFAAIVELPEQPDVGAAAMRTWGTHDDLLTRLANTLEEETERTNPAVDATDVQLDDERRLLGRLEEISKAAEGQSNSERFGPFAQRMSELTASVRERRIARAEELRILKQKELETQQEQLLAAARQHAKAGELTQSLENYDSLLELEGSETLLPFLEGELEEVRMQHAALEVALEQARAGEHPAAIQTLRDAELDPAIFPLPWRVESEPPGARVRLSNGSERTTPFAMETAAGTNVRLEFHLKGTEGARVDVTEPGDVHVMLHRSPERVWVEKRLVEAIPVAVGADEVVADRLGRVERIDADGEVVWELELPTLAGVSRTPRFLPTRPGMLLVLAEDGQAWLVDVESGDSEGPWSSPSPPSEGLIPLRTSLAAVFEDGSLAIWEEGLTPRVRSSKSLLDQPGFWDDEDPSAKLDHAVSLHRGTSEAPELGNPWNPWRCEVLDDRFLVRKGGSDPETFTISRVGRWQFVAWERPNALAPTGRLWVSDESGLRSFLP